MSKKTLKVNEGASKFLEELVERVDAKNREEVVTEALRLYKWVLDSYDKGDGVSNYIDGHLHKSKEFVERVEYSLLIRYITNSLEERRKLQSSMSSLF